MVVPEPAVILGARWRFSNTKEYKVELFGVKVVGMSLKMLSWRLRVAAGGRKLRLLASERVEGIVRG